MESSDQLNVRKFKPNFDELAETCVERINRVWRQCYPIYLFANPLVVITAQLPSATLAKSVQEFRKEWMHRFRENNKRQAKTSPKDWRIPYSPTPKHSQNLVHLSEFSTRFDHFLLKSLCYTGILFHQGKVVPSDNRNTVLKPDGMNAVRKD